MRIPILTPHRMVMWAASLRLATACTDTGPPVPGTAEIGERFSADGSIVDAGAMADVAETANPADGGLEAVLPTDVSAQLAILRDETGLVALGGAVVGPEGLIAVGTDGLRSLTSTIRVTNEDRWHLGSNTKAMTGYLSAILVEKGTLSWDTTVAEVFPEHRDGMQDSLRSLTLVELLTNRAGLPTEMPEDILIDLWRNEGPLPDQRARFVGAILARRPAAPPRTVYIYSNSGFIVAGAMLEREAGQAWEVLMEREVFEPLHMKDCGFGPAASSGRLDAPWGHRNTQPPQSVPPGPAADNPPAVGPAGTVHCPLSSWANYIAAHLRGGEGSSELLSVEAFTRLHQDPGFGTPDGFGYGFGWSILSRDWAGGLTLTHAGSNTLNRSVAWLAPTKSRAYLAVANEDLDRTPPALDRAVGALLGAFPPP